MSYSVEQLYLNQGSFQNFRGYARLDHLFYVNFIITYVINEEKHGISKIKKSNLNDKIKCKRYNCINICIWSIQRDLNSNKLQSGQIRYLEYPCPHPLVNQFVFR